MDSFKNKTVVISGGTSGIGLSLSRAFVSEGANVVMLGMDRAKAERQAIELSNKGSKIIGLQCDVTNRSAVESMADYVYNEFGQVDILINNAGVGHVGALHEIDDSDWDWILNVNLKSIFIMSSVFIKRFLNQEQETLIINTGSETCFGLPGTALGSMFPYVASKHGMLGLSEMMARDYAKNNIRVSVLCPGPVATEIWNAERSRQDTYGEKEQTNPQLGTILHQLGMNPDDVAAMTIEGIKRRSYYIITHSNIRDLVNKRHREASQALDQTDKWHEHNTH